MNFQADREYARHLDGEDELASFRDHFVIDNPRLIYLDGNSLGRLSKAALSGLQTVVRQEWGGNLIRSWNAGWYEAPDRVGEKIARIAGAGPGQIVAGDSTSVNLFKLSMAALTLRPDRPCVVSDVFNFPSDLYILQGCVKLLGDRRRLRLIPSRDDIAIDRRDLLEAINEETALVVLSHAAFKSGFLYDAEWVTRRAHEKGALVLWDLSHSIGAVPVALDQWGADLAVGCTYKYLNGGPGSPAFLYVARRLQDQMISPIWGWFGQNSPFAFGLDYQPAAGIRRFLGGTPPVLSLLAMESALDPLLQAGVQAVRRKSVRLTSYFVFLLDDLLAPFGFKLGSPRDPESRGSHVSIRHPDGYRICQALIREMDVLPDFRDPDNIRLGFAPLYTSFSEVWEAADRIRQVMEKKLYERIPSERCPVT